MSERYVELFYLPRGLYASGVPVIIEAGRLLKDNATGGVVAQLKFINITSKKIKALSVKISPKDTDGNNLGDYFDYQYINLAAKPGDSFGSRIPIRLPDDKTRSFSVYVSEVIFEDNTIWTGDNEGEERRDVADASDRVRRIIITISLVIAFIAVFVILLVTTLSQG